MAWVNSFNNTYAGGVYESANHWNADMLAVKYNGKITEFEIKVSKADLRGEVAAARSALLPDTVEQTPLFPYATAEAIEQNPYLGKMQVRIRKDVKLSHTKIAKHRCYLVDHTKDMYSCRPLFYPNLFYFAVPGDLVDYALEAVIGLPYGVFNLDSMSVAKSAKSIRTEPYESGVYLDLFNRACTQRRDMQQSVRAQNYRLVERIAQANGLLVGSLGRLRLDKVLKEHHTAEGLDDGPLNVVE